MEATLNARSAPLTFTQWLIFITAGIGFAFDMYEIVVQATLVGPMLEDLGPFQKLPAPYHVLEDGTIDIVIVDSLAFVGARGAGGGGYGKANPGKLLHDFSHEGRLSPSRGGRDDEDDSFPAFDPIWA